MPHFQHVEFLYLLILIPVFAGLFMYALYKAWVIEQRFLESEKSNKI